MGRRVLTLRGSLKGKTQKGPYLLASGELGSLQYQRYQAISKMVFAAFLVKEHCANCSFPPLPKGLVYSIWSISNMNTDKEGISLVAGFVALAERIVYNSSFKLQFSSLACFCRKQQAMLVYARVLCHNRNILRLVKQLCGTYSHFRVSQLTKA